MAFRPKSIIPDISNLKSLLMTSQLQQTNQPLFQVISNLIDFLQRRSDVTQTTLGSGGASGGVVNQSILTVNNDQTTLPNSRQLIPGTGIGFMNNGRQLIVNASPMPPVGIASYVDSARSASANLSIALGPNPIGGFTEGSVIFAGPGGILSQNNSKFFWDNTNETLKITHGSGVLEAPPANEFPHIHIGGDYDGVAAGIGVLFIDGYGAQGNITMRRSNGTQASPTALAASDVIFNFRSYGYDGSAYGLGGTIRMIANGAWSGTNHGQDFLINLTANGSTANPAERLRLSTTELRLNNAILITWGTTSSFPALKRSSAVLQTRLADDSGFAQHSALEFMNNRANFLMRTAVTWNDGAAAAVGTLNNAPTAGDPTKWIPVDDNGTTRYIPAW